MRKGKRLSRADGLNVLRTAYDLIMEEKENFICLAIRSAGKKYGVGRHASAEEMIPELDLLRPYDRSPGNAWFPVKERKERLRILRRLIAFYERDRHESVIDRVARRIRSFFNV